ncbi:hypothetical protein GCM10022217_31340 [Chryseobacterium ginsenosidimutans]|uniref:hypothetical protein n=1 Tax=Chryseobacterium ginsenosidimutans TaxID=687846 RepID=UPI0031D88F7B
MKKLFAIISILFLFSCNNNDDETVQEQKCYMTKFNKAVIALAGQQFYTSEYVYDGNRVIKKLEYKLIDNSAPGQQYPTYAPQLDRTIEVQYNSANQPIKIIQPLDIYNTQTIDYLLYDNQGRLSEKNIVTEDYANNFSYTKNAIYSYNSNNQIISISEKTTNNWGDIYNENTKSLTYDTDGNLRVIEQVNAGNSGYKWVTKYDNYDSYKNPYANVNVPFEDIFFLRLSKNNYRKYFKTMVYTTNSPTNPAAPYESSEISGYEYTENGYPKIAEYKCN